MSTTGLIASSTLACAALVTSLVALGPFGGAAGATSVPHGLTGATIATLVIPGTSGSMGPILGDGSPAGHGVGAIELHSWSFGQTNAGVRLGGGGTVGGRPKFTSITISKSIDKSSPKLMEACATGRHLGTVTIYLDSSNADGTMATDVTITLYNTRVSSDQVSGASSGEAPKEEVTFEYSAISFDYGAPGTAATHFGWNLTSNRAA